MSRPIQSSQHQFSHDTVQGDGIVLGFLHTHAVYIGESIKICEAETIVRHDDACFSDEEGCSQEDDEASDGEEKNSRGSLARVEKSGCRLRGSVKRSCRSNP